MNVKKNISFLLLLRLLFLTSYYETKTSDRTSGGIDIIKLLHKRPFNERNLYKISPAAPLSVRAAFVPLLLQK